MVLSAVGCGSAERRRPETPVARASGEPIEFAFGRPDGGLFDSASTRGRVTVVLFVTTFDLASQVQAKQLNQTLRRYRPRINAGAVVLEAPKYAVFADAFGDSLGLIYPIALADTPTREGRGPFGEIEGVPTVVVLSRDGREVWRKFGHVPPRELDRVLARAGAR